MNLIFYIALFVPLLPLLILLLGRNTWHPVKRDFTLMLVSIIVISFGAEVWKYLVFPNNLPFFHIYLLIEFFLLTKIMSQFMGESMLKGKWLFFIGAFGSIWLINVVFGQGIMQFPNFTLGAEALLVLIYAVGWFAKMLREKKIKNPAKSFEFWFCTSLFVFFSGNLLVFIFYLFIINASADLLNPIWAIHAILIILLYLLYSFAILWIPKTIK